MQRGLLPFAVVLVAAAMTDCRARGNAATVDAAPLAEQDSGSDAPDAAAGSTGTPAGAATASSTVAHRPAAVACDFRKHPPGTHDPHRKGCQSDSECTAHANGRCESVHDSPNACTYDECTRDEDCKGDPLASKDARGVCLCGGYWGLDSQWVRDGAYFNRCVYGGCRTDGDCPNGASCSPGSRCDFKGYFCHGDGDECRSDADCAKGRPGLWWCGYDGEGKHWKCKYDCPQF
jgi:hypothetical protein